MTYTVVWTFEARTQLAEIWLEAYDQISITKAADRLDRELRIAPRTLTTALREGLWKATIEPLTVILEIREADRTIEVAAVRLAKTR
jgi:hypothetical protein